MKIRGLWPSTLYRLKQADLAIFHLAMAALPRSLGYVVTQNWTSGRNHKGGTNVFDIPMEIKVSPHGKSTGSHQIRDFCHYKCKLSTAKAKMNVFASSFLQTKDSD